MALFGKKRVEQDAEALLDADDLQPQPSAAESDPLLNKASTLSAPIHEANQFEGMHADIERVKAMMEALKDARKVSNERFARISEEIGELRSMLIDREKEIQEIDVKSSRASELVAEVQPERLMQEVQREDLKLQTLQGRFEQLQGIISELAASVKEVKSQISVFRGVEQVIQLSEDVKKELEMTRKMETEIGRHADKVEQIFITIRKRFPEIDELKRVSEEMKSEHNGVLRDFEDLKLKLVHFSEKREIDELRASLNRLASQWQGRFEDIARFRDELNATVQENKAMREEITRNLQLVDQKLFGVISREELLERLKAIRTEVAEEARDEMRKALLEHNIASKKDESSQMDEIKRLVSIAHIQVNDKKFDAAKKAYIQANTMYETLPKERQLELYDSLEDLYKRLEKVD